MSMLTEREFAEKVAQHGGRVYRVGGCVRDKFMGIQAKDIDYSIASMVKKNFKELFPEAKECGKAFPVFLLMIDGLQREVAFARTEEKVGTGYKGFRVSAKPKITIEQDLFRRDTTINSMAEDCLTGDIIDPYRGQKDIEEKLLRATSLHFPDDPMRALRLAGQAARFDFSIHPDTANMAMAVKEELAKEPAERMIIELGKVLKDAKEPARFFKVLAQTQLLPAVFREIAVLPPEKFSYMLAVLDRVANFSSQPKIRFAALGAALNEKEFAVWNKRMTIPGEWLGAAVAVSQTIGLLQVLAPENIVDTITKLRRGFLSVEEFDIISQAAEVNIPLLTPFKAVLSLKGEVIPENLQGKEIGEWLRQRRIKVIEEKLNHEIGS